MFLISIIFKTGLPKVCVRSFSVVKTGQKFIAMSLHLFFSKEIFDEEQTAKKKTKTNSRREQFVLNASDACALHVVTGVAKSSVRAIVVLCFHWLVNVTFIFSTSLRPPKNSFLSFDFPSWWSRLVFTASVVNDLSLFSKCEKLDARMEVFRRVFHTSNSVESVRPLGL